MQNGIQQRQESAYDLSRFQVLVVEDSPFIGGLMVSALREMGVGKATAAKGVADARERILKQNAVPSIENIDVVIVDWLMPDGNGSDLLGWIRAHKTDTIKYLPVIMCSAYASQEMVEKSRNNGVNEILVKPVSAEKLARRILYVIDRPRPYVSNEDFFGPDRRRQSKSFTGIDKRKMQTEDLEEEHEQLQ